MDEYSKLLYVLAGVALSGFVGFVLKAIGDLRNRVTRLEVKGESADGIADKLEKLTALVWEIAGKLGIPIRRD